MNILLLPRSRALAMALAVLSTVGSAAAEKADRLKPLKVEADVGRYDDQKQVGTFSGHVVVTKGTMEMRAAQIQVRQGADGYHHGVATAAAGERATFRQKRDGVDEIIEGQAERIEYDGKTDTVRFVGRAVIRRLAGGKVTDEASGSVISYDNQAEVFSVTGGASAASPGNPEGRVRAVLTPREGTAAAAEAASQPASAPRDSAGGQP